MTNFNASFHEALADYQFCCGAARKNACASFRVTHEAATDRVHPKRFVYRVIWVLRFAWQQILRLSRLPRCLLCSVHLLVMSWLIAFSTGNYLSLLPMYATSDWINKWIINWINITCSPLFFHWLTNTNWNTYVAWWWLIEYSLLDNFRMPMLTIDFDVFSNLPNPFSSVLYSSGMSHTIVHITLTHSSLLPHTSLSVVFSPFNQISWLFSSYIFFIFFFAAIFTPEIIKLHNFPLSSQSTGPI